MGKGKQKTKNGKRIWSILASQNISDNPVSSWNRIPAQMNLRLFERANIQKNHASNFRYRGEYVAVIMNSPSKMNVSLR